MAVWTENLHKLKAYKKEFGNCNVPATWGKDKQLALWVENIRKSRNSLPRPLVQELNKLGFDFELNPSADWESMYKRLKEFFQVRGHSFVPYEKEWEDLFYWVRLQKQSGKYLSDTRRKKLDALRLDWSSTSIFQINWENRYEELKAYYKKYGRKRIPYVDEEHRKLYEWVQNQRNQKTNLSKERIQKLNAIGFDWDADRKKTEEELWDAQFQELKKFSKKYGHCYIPSKGEEYARLRNWVHTQRAEASKLPAFRKVKLNNIGFLFKEDVQKDRDSRWNTMYEHLLSFYKKNRHFRIPEDKYPKLKRWLAFQKRNRFKLKKERLKKLDSIGIQWIEDNKTRRDKLFEKNFKRLKTFYQKHGHSLIPTSDKELWRWIVNLRVWHKRLSKEQLNQLKEVDFDFRPGKEKVAMLKWKARYEQLKAFKQKHGHCNLSRRNPKTKSLALWIMQQRKRQHLLTNKQKEELQKVGIIKSKTI